MRQPLPILLIALLLLLALLGSVRDDADRNGTDPFVGEARVESAEAGEAVAPIPPGAGADTVRARRDAWSDRYHRNCSRILIDSETVPADWTPSRYAGSHDRTLFDTWTPLDTEHFRFRFSRRVRDMDLEAYAARHEATFREIAAWFDWEPDGPVRMYVWSGNDEAGDHGLPRLGVSCAEASVIHAHPWQTVGHEMTHVVSLRAARPKIVSGLLAEGVAEFHDRRAGDRFALARVAWIGRPDDAPRPSLRELWNDWLILPEEVSRPVSGAFVEFLVERGGRDRFLELFREQSLARAEIIYGDDFGAWVEEFERRLNGS